MNWFNGRALFFSALTALLCTSNSFADNTVEEGYLFIANSSKTQLPAYWIPETEYLKPGKCKMSFDGPLKPVQKGEVEQWDTAYMEHKFSIYSVENAKIVSCEQYTAQYTSDPVTQNKSQNFETSMKRVLETYTKNDYVFNKTKTSVYFLKCIEPLNACTFQNTPSSKKDKQS